MKLPKMILFDYGHTLFYEPEFVPERGYREILKYAIRNDRNLSVMDITEESGKLLKEIADYKDKDIEVNNLAFQRLLFDTLGIEFSLSEEDIEMEFWKAAEPIYPMKHIGELLSFLKKAGIRTGVVSNISFSSNTLLKRIKEQIPESNFEFVITSSEYMFRKPNLKMFEAAIMKSGLNRAEIWYCGDGIKLDIESSAKCGMYPVWYESNIKRTYRKEDQDIKPMCSCIHIHDWLELQEILDKQLTVNNQN